MSVEWIQTKLANGRMGKVHVADGTERQGSPVTVCGILLSRKSDKRLPSPVHDLSVSHMCVNCARIVGREGLCDRPLATREEAS